jgi:hypothetical protein
VFRFLHSIFATTPSPPGKLDATLIKAAIERVVDGTDPRLRAVPHFQRKLWEPVERAVHYVVEHAATLPPAIAFDRRHFTTDPRLRALFANPEHLLESLSFNPALRGSLQPATDSPPTEIFAALRMERTEKTVFGVELHGDRVLRDIQQTAVNFHNHHIAFPATSEAATRQELQKRAFDYLIEAALQRLLSIRARKNQLEQQQRRLLQQKAQVLKSARLGLAPLIANPSTPRLPDSATTERQLREIEAELRLVRADSATIGEQLALVAATLREPGQHLRLERISLTLDHMNIRVPAHSPRASNTLTFDEVLIDNRHRFIILLVRVPSSEIPPPPDFFAEAQRLLGAGGGPRLTTI